MTPAAPAGLPGLDPSWSRWVTVPGADGEKHRWHVLDNGVADPVGTLLCVHGNPTWSYLWRRLLATAPPGWRVVAPDQLGMGWSARPAGPRTLTRRVADLGDLTAAMAISGPVVTVAHDWGGIISLGWALEHRSDVRGVVLTNTAVAMPEGDLGPALIRLAHAPGLRAAVTVGSSVFVRGATALSWPPLPREVRRAYAQPYPSAAQRRAVGEFVADIPFRPGHPSRTAQEAIAEGIRTLDVPALLLWGPRDPVFGERYLADLRERLPRAAVHRYEGASHLLPEDAPQYAEAVATWVSDTFSAPDAPAAAGRATPAEPPARPWSALTARSDDDSPAIVETGGGSVSWARLSRRVADIAAGLAASGVGPGNRVALLLEPSADLTAAVYATWRAGAVIVVADKGLGLRGMRRALRGAAPDHVLGSAAGLAAARAMGLPGTRILAGRATAPVRRALAVEHDLASLEALGRSSPAPPECPPDADCAVVFTSGATGPAKGVVYTQRQVGAQLELVRAAYRLAPDDSLVAAFAPFSILGPGLGIASSVPDVDVTAPGTLTAGKLADAAAAVDATVVFAAPAALRRVAATAGELTGEQRTALRRIRLLMSAGAPVPPPLLRALRETFPAAEPHTPYGMTEALPVTDVSFDEVEAAGPGNGVCVGRPVPGVEVRISPLSPLGAADGALTGSPGVTGEICVRAPHVKDRYDALWATERAAGRDPGWHRTGDVGHLDGDGRLWVEGRLAHVVTAADGPVTPVGPEQRIEGLAAVSAAAVIGVGPVGVQVAVAVVVPSTAAGKRRPPVPARRGRLTVAPPGLADEVRRSAGVDVAAVLVTDALPVDIRHQSKVDRAALARRASRLLSGTPVRWAARRGTA
ncbi:MULTISPECIES: alpha/beta fold hydrolase [unclassified Blastococcus]|uniref:alpha/beta fold hydrolase n=1 Tax=unclassified Blastococcus TaxID=2619396 RepID=UPI001EEFDD7A|nr:MULTISPECIES: alpha/beta fold hydrolase [unclassified Blastococcus]